MTVELSTRFRTSLGLCRPAQGRIRLAADLVKGRGRGGSGHGEGQPQIAHDLLEEVFCHELAHVAVHRLHGKRGKPHGPEWKALMVQAGFPPNVRVRENDPRLPDQVSRPRPRWEHRCPVCGIERIAGRPVRQWRCVRCRKAGRSGKLEIRKLHH